MTQVKLGSRDGATWVISTALFDGQMTQVSGGGDDDEGGAGVDLVALGDEEFGDGAGRRGQQLVLHLHRLEDGDERTGLDLGAGRDRELDHLARHRGDERSFVEL